MKIKLKELANKLKESRLKSVVSGAKVRYEEPPIFQHVCAAFSITPKTVFTYGDTIYNPFKLDLPQDLMEHEKRHMEQQSHSPEHAALWWGRYLRDEKFRLEQEAEAFGSQYRHWLDRTSDREKLHRILNQLAQSLSSPLYGRIVEHAEATLLIKQYARD